MKKLLCKTNNRFRRKLIKSRYYINDFVVNDQYFATCIVTRVLVPIANTHLSRELIPVYDIIKIIIRQLDAVNFVRPVWIPQLNLNQWNALVCVFMHNEVHFRCASLIELILFSDAFDCFLRYFYRLLLAFVANFVKANLVKRFPAL